jgi:energy-coupling factor transport system ATP-binding protein
MGIIKTEELVFEYIKRDEDGNVEGTIKAIDHVDLDIAQGEFIAILGHNGSGKSTLAKHLNAILNPTEGTVWVDGMDTSEEEKIWEVRRSAGMVFQNPDNQIIGQVVEEDVGFGPENMGVATKEIWERVEESLRAVGMYEYRKSSPNKLSGGQKQRVSIAGVLAMHPKCIVLDEPTAMLDPSGRKEVIRAVRGLNDVEGVTVILITHYMEEIVHADRVFIMDDGKVAMQGTPKEIFSQVEKLKALRLDVPQVTLLSYELQKQGVPLPDGILTVKELAEELEKVRGKATVPHVAVTQTTDAPAAAPHVAVTQTTDAPVTTTPGSIRLENVTYIYEAGTPLEKIALDNVSLEIPDGQFVGIIGHTGSGKSTLIQHLNGLVKASSGHIYYRDEDINAKDYDRKALRSKVGLVFQYPEHQLFEMDVFTDVCFGPKNLGLSQEEVEKRACEALEQVGLPEELYRQSPFDLSGGQKRRAAIAGVLAMKPEVLILDEPTAGLDPKGREEILNQIKTLQEKSGMTILLVSHSMEDVAEYVDRIIVMNDGAVMYDGTPKEVFSHYRELEEVGLAAPQVTYIMHELHKRSFAVDTQATTIEEAAKSILAAL